MIGSVLPAESEPIGLVSTGWLWAARCSAVIRTIALGVGFVAEAAAEKNGLAALISFGPQGEEFTGICAWSGRGNGFDRPAPSRRYVVAVGAPPGFLPKCLVGF